MAVKRALILVDLQNDFMPGGALAVPDGDLVIPIANEMQTRFATIVATQDWHPANHGSFAINHPGRNPGDVIELNGLRQVLWPRHCVQNTRGADLVAGLQKDHIHQVFHKGVDPAIDSYSGFFDNGHRKSTGLAHHLKSSGITDVYILGLATDYCVKFTALDAMELGFTTHLIADGCKGVELKPGDSESAIDRMRTAGVEILNSAAVPDAGEMTVK